MEHGGPLIAGVDLTDHCSFWLQCTSTSEPVTGDRLRARITLPSGQELESVALFSSRMLSRASPGSMTQLNLEAVRARGEKPIAGSN